MIKLTENLFENILDNIYDGVYFTDLERRITFWNKSAERITGFSKEEVLGKKCSANILNHVDSEGNRLCTGNCPLAYSIKDGVSREAQVFLHHKEGFRLPVAIKVAAVTNDLGEIIGGVEIFNDNSHQIKLFKHIEELKLETNLDSLTKLANRRHIEYEIRNQIEYHKQMDGGIFGLLFLDIDHFKKVNDKYGHNAGDRVLEIVAQTARHAAREQDLMGRWGGEEFIGIIKNVNKEQLSVIASRMLTMVKNSWITIDGHHISVTVSIGSTLYQPGEPMDKLIARCDQLMYQSKEGGRDRVTIA